MVKKTEYDTKISRENENKFTDYNHYNYIATPEFNKLAKEVFDARLLRANLVTKTDTKLTRVYKKLAQIKENIYSLKRIEITKII